MSVTFIIRTDSYVMNKMSSPYIKIAYFFSRAPRKIIIDICFVLSSSICNRLEIMGHATQIVHAEVSLSRAY